MKLAFSTLGCPEWSWADIVSAGADLGFDALEIRGIQNELRGPKLSVFAPDNLAKTQATLARTDLHIACLATGCALREQPEAAISEIRAYIDTAERAGIPYVRVMAEDTPTPEQPVDDGATAETLAALAPYAAQRSVTVLLESNGCYADTARLAALMATVEQPGLGLLWDVHHPYRFFGESPEQTAGNIGRWVRHTHFKDSILRDGKPLYRMMGFGDLPLRGFVQELSALGYTGCFTLEWLRRWDKTLEEPGVALAQFIDYMRNL